jgi:hypothetical protein
VEKLLPHRQSWIKVLFFWVLIFLPTFVVLEAASYILIKKMIPTRISGRVGRGSIEFHLAQRKQVPLQQPKLISEPSGTPVSKGGSTRGLRMFHPVLGWDYPSNIIYQDIDNIVYHHGSHGERRTCTSYVTTLIATYGDSFTYCANVRDEDTWQTFLARKLGSNVLNFGVGAYGTDQAELKYELQNQVRTRIVMLCIFPENINRVVNIYRPFYTYVDPVRLTKPLFVKSRDGLKLVANPVKSVGDLSKLDDPAFLTELAKLDYWYQFDKNLPRLSFPWLFCFFHWWRPVLKQVSLSIPHSLNPCPPRTYPWNLFDEDYPLSVMCHVVDRFVATARKRDAIPIIVIVPHEDYVQELMDHGISRVAKLVDFLSRQKYPFIDAVQVVADMKPSRLQLDAWYHGHATREGNEVLADILSRYLKSNWGDLLRAGGSGQLQ